jgi:hypothetical protein
MFQQSIFSKLDILGFQHTILLVCQRRFERKLSTVKNSLDQRRLTKVIPIVLTIVLLTLPAVLSHSIVLVSANTSSGTTSTEQLVTDYTAQYVGTVNVASLPAPSASDATPLSMPDLSLSLQDQSSTDPLAVVTPGSQQFIHIVKDFAGTPGTNPNPCRCTPPDMGLAASSKFVVQMVNLAGTIWKNNGVRVTTFSLSDFWFLPVRGGPLGIGMSDPLVLYDAAADRFYAMIIDTFDVNRVNFAVTATNDPTGAWFIYRVIANCNPTAPYGPCQPASSFTLPDQPYIGYSSDKFLITANDFQFDPTFSASSFIGAQYWILNKAEMLSGCTAPTPCPSGRNIDAVTNAVPNGHFSIRPAQHLSPTPLLGTDTTPTAYLAENCLTVTPGVLVSVCRTSPTPADPGGMNVTAVHGTPGTTSSTSVSTTTVAIHQIHFPAKADQPGNPASLSTANQARITSVVWRAGLLWTALNDGRSSTGCPQATCARLDQISTTTFTALQDFDLVLPGASVFYPALTTDSQNNLAVIFGSSSSTKNPDLEVIGQLTTMAPDTLSQASVLIASTAVDLSTRWGDYFWAATDPATPNTFWVSGEFRTVSLFQGWSTQVGEISFNTS